MSKEELIELDGVVSEVLPQTVFRVTLEMSPYDLTKGRINYRHKDANAAPRPAARPQFRRR